MVTELTFRKDGALWVAYDDFGNSARGITKDHAKNNYILAYRGLTPDINLGVNMSNVERSFNNDNL